MPSWHSCWAQISPTRKSVPLSIYYFHLSTCSQLQWLVPPSPCQTSLATCILLPPKRGRKASLVSACTDTVLRAKHKPVGLKNTHLGHLYHENAKSLALFTEYIPQVHRVENSRKHSGKAQFKASGTKDQIHAPNLLGRNPGRPA